MASLERAQQLSDTSYQREHVTVWLFDSATITKANLKQDGPDASHHRWTLDTPEDYRFLSEVFAHYADALDTMRWRDLLARLEQTRELMPSVRAQ